MGKTPAKPCALEEALRRTEEGGQRGAVGKPIAWEPSRAPSLFLNVTLVCLGVLPL